MIKMPIKVLSILLCLATLFGAVAFAFNFPSARVNTTLSKDTDSFELIKYIREKYASSNYLKLHAGMVFDIGEVKVETLGTIENIVDINATIPDEWDTNDTCTLLRFYLGDRSVMMEGDVGNHRNVQDYHIALYSPEYLKSDILQISHHGYNDLVTLNKYCDPDYALVSNAVANVGKRSYYESLVGAGNVYYAGEYTTAITVTRERITVKKVAR